MNINIKKQFTIGFKMLNDPCYIDVNIKTLEEINKCPSRTEIINFILNFLAKDRNTIYLEIGVRNPNDNFNKINSTTKYSVDPGVEFELNPVDFKMTSDNFFKSINSGKILDKDIKFDVIFIDGLHIALQVDRDIENALKFIKDDGFIILHDCNPPSEFHARENYDFRFTPAKGFWNGTVWKAFYKYRKSKNYYSCCVDTDWGVGIISKSKNIGESTSIKNDFYDFSILNNNRKESLNLIDFEVFKKLFN